MLGGLNTDLPAIVQIFLHTSMTGMDFCIANMYFSQLDHFASNIFLLAATQKRLKVTSSIFIIIIVVIILLYY